MNFPENIILADTDDLAHAFPPPVNGTHPTAWTDWDELQDRANLTACGAWNPTPETPGYGRTWDVRRAIFLVQEARLVRVEGERALYRADDRNFYWVYPPPVRPDTDRYPTETLRGRRAEYWGPRDPAASAQYDWTTTRTEAPR